MRSFWTVSLLALGLAFVPTAKAADLPRRPFLGLQLQPAPGGTGVAVGNVFPGGTAAAVQVKVGDIIAAVNGKGMRSPDEVVAFAQGLATGDPVIFDIVRSGQPLKLSGKATAKPLEHYARSTVDYGSVEFRGGRIRDVLVTPEGAPDGPVLFYLQGYTCAPVEGGPPDVFHQKFGQALLANGIGYYRVEKIGVGDSSGPLRCQDVDFATELDGFKAAYHHLIDDRKIAPKRIFMLGHSMGGIQAPFLASEIAPRGVAAYGTVVRNWADYYQDLAWTQGFLMGGEDPVDSAKRGETTRDLIRMFYIDKMTPAAIAKARPGSEASMRELFNWDGGANMFGRSWKFAQDLSSIALVEAWKKSKTNVLALYGGSDMVALTDADHRYLADIANYWRPGSGTFVEVPDTGHGMELAGSRSAIREASRNGTPAASTPFNPKVVDALAQWIKASMAIPPVAG